ncbi:MAG TPA: GNAT family N-acetyltransferase [Gemmatimonadota bacterium]|nr:GNAT family N-acetyltransferase [Gemmatimonadota bacterium]
MRQASFADVDQLVALMAEFYAESDYPLNAQRATEAFKVLVADERLGRAWLVEAQGADVGYLVVTLGYSMEYGGVDAFIDDLYVRPAFRRAGLGTAAVREARAFCLARGVRALHLEVDQANSVARSVYRKAGFVSNDRQLLTLVLDTPTHAT